MTNKRMELRYRFVHDTDAPIPVLEAPWFEYFLDKYEEQFGTRTTWDKLWYEIREKADSDLVKWLDMYYQSRDALVRKLHDSPAYERLNTCDMSRYDMAWFDTKGVKSVYSDSQPRVLLSVDLKQGNFNALKHEFPDLFDNARTWEEVVAGVTDSGHMARSKYMRQVVFGQLNPKRTIKIEEWLSGKAGFWLTLAEPALKERLLMWRTDEAVFDLTDDPELTKKVAGNLENLRKDLQGLDYPTRLELLRVSPVTYETPNGEEFTCHLKERLGPDMLTTKYELKSCPLYYHAQVWSLMFGDGVVKQEDLYTTLHGQTVRFEKPIRRSRQFDGMPIVKT